MTKFRCLLFTLLCVLAATAEGQFASPGSRKTYTFNWEGLSLDYPLGYRITDQEYDGETYHFCCKIDCTYEDCKNGGEFTQINFSILKDDDGELASHDVEDILGVLKLSVEAVCQMLRTDTHYDGLRFGNLETAAPGRYPGWGPYPRASRTFFGNMMGISSHGKVVAIFGKGKLVCMLVQAVSRDWWIQGRYFDDLRGIVDSVRFE